MAQSQRKNVGMVNSPLCQWGVKPTLPQSLLGCGRITQSKESAGLGNQGDLDGLGERCVAFWGRKTTGPPDNPIGMQQERRGNREAERLGCLEVDRQLEAPVDIRQAWRIGQGPLASTCWTVRSNPWTAAPAGRISGLADVTGPPRGPSYHCHIGPSGAMMVSVQLCRSPTELPHQ